MHWKQYQFLLFSWKIAVGILSHILWNHPQQPLHSAICLLATLLSNFIVHSTVALQHYFYRFFKTFPDACSVLRNFVTLSSSKQWIKWDLIFEVLNLASIGDLWCDKKWMLLQRRRSQLHLTVAELAKQ